MLAWFHNDKIILFLSMGCVFRVTFANRLNTIASHRPFLAARASCHQLFVPLPRPLHHHHLQLLYSSPPRLVRCVVIVLLLVGANVTRPPIILTHTLNQIPYVLYSKRSSLFTLCIYQRWLGSVQLLTKKFILIWHSWRWLLFDTLSTVTEEAFWPLVIRVN